MIPDRPCSFLYVDDDQDLLHLGKTFLERAGKFFVDTVDSAQGALEMFVYSSFDPIISDYQMPSKDGIEFLKTLRSRKSTLSWCSAVPLHPKRKNVEAFSLLDSQMCPAVEKDPDDQGFGSPSPAPSISRLK